MILHIVNIVHVLILPIVVIYVKYEQIGPGRTALVLRLLEQSNTGSYPFFGYNIISRSTEFQWIYINIRYPGAKMDILSSKNILCPDPFLDTYIKIASLPNGYIINPTFGYISYSVLEQSLQPDHS